PRRSAAAWHLIFLMVSLLVLFLEGVTEVGVGNLDKVAGPLAQGLPLQGSHAVLGDDVVHVIAAGGDGGSLVQQWDNLGDLALDGGGHGHDGDAALTGGGTADKVHLAAHAGDLLGPD